MASQRLEHLHELVHSVELAALGRAHPVLLEGMAEYLSSAGSTTGAFDDFADVFPDVLDGDGELGYYDYRKAMHFVGSIVEKHGIEQYLVFRSRAPVDGGAAAFAASYEEVFGESFEAALDEMSQSPILGRWQPWGCGDGYESLPWPTSEGGTLDVTIGGACGDPGFYGGGFVADEPGFLRDFALDVEVGGFFETAQLGGDPEFMLSIVPCPGTNVAGIFGSHSMPIGGILPAGRYSVQIWFPASDKASAEVTLAVTLSLAVPP